MGWFEKIMVGTLFPLLFCGIGSFLLWESFAYFKVKKDKKYRCLSYTYGKIVNIDSMKTNRKRAYFPTYEYRVDNEIIRIEMNWGTTYCQYKRGDQVKVWYDYNDPQYSYIDGYRQDNTAAIGGMIVGSMVLLSSILTLFFCMVGLDEFLFGR